MSYLSSYLSKESFQSYKDELDSKFDHLLYYCIQQGRFASQTLAHRQKFVCCIPLFLKLFSR